MNLVPPDRNRKTDVLDDLLSSADPGAQASHIEPLQAQWDQLFAERKVRRRAVSAAFVLLIVGSVAFAVLARRDDKIAVVDPDKPAASVIGEPAGDPQGKEAAGADAIDLPTSHGRDNRDWERDRDRERDSQSVPVKPEGELPETEDAEPSPGPTKAQPLYAKNGEAGDAAKDILQAVEELEGDDVEAWQELVIRVREAPPAVQESLVIRLGSETELPQRSRAMQLVVEASGPWADALLVQWLSSQVSREPAWEMLFARTPDRDLGRLVSLASRPSERAQVCQRIVRLPGSAAADAFVRLAPDARWRPLIATACHEMGGEARGRLLDLLRDGSPVERAGAGFVVATLPGTEVDRQLAEMIARGRSRQAAYLALLARRTPEALQFLRAASRDTELAPALHSAQYGWQSFGPITLTWLSELEEKRDDIDSAGRPHDGLDRGMVAGRLPALGRPATG